ncbi:MAG: TolC family protein, partial [Chitinophagales bacterium]
GLRPTVTLVASENLQGSELADLSDSWMVTLNASYTVFDWGAAKARLAQAEANARGLELRVKGLQDQILVEVQQAYQALLEARERIPVAETNVTQAKENLSITQIRYEAGLATTVDVLDSQMLLTQSESAYVQAVFDYDLALAKLAKASGDTGLIK